MSEQDEALTSAVKSELENMLENALKNVLEDAETDVLRASVDYSNNRNSQSQLWMAIYSAIKGAMENATKIALNGSEDLAKEIAALTNHTEEKR